MSTETEKLKLFKWDTSNEIDLESDFDIEKTLNENWDRIDDNTAEVSKKNIEQDNSISELQEEIENLRNISNIMPSVNETGENITLNNTAKNVRFRKFKVGGNVKQETREGYNLLNANLPYTTSSSENTIKWLGKENIPKIEVNKYYYLHGKFSDGTTFSGAHAAFVITDGMRQILNKTFGSSFQNTVDISNATNCYIYTDSTYANKTVTEVAIYEGKENKAYEQYGASPSPDYPSEIKTVGSQGSVKVTKCNKNLFDKSKALIGHWIIDEQGNIGQAGATAFVTDFIPVFKDVPVYIPATGTSRRELYNKNKVGIQYLNNSDVQIFTPTEDGFIRVSCNMATITMDNLMIFYGETSTPYEPHQEQSYIMPVQQEMLTDDFFDWINEEEVHNWSKLVLNGNENWKIESVGRFGIMKSDLSKIPMPTSNNNDYLGNMCNYYKESTPALTWKKEQGFCIDGSSCLRIYDTTYSSSNNLEGFKEYLKAQYEAETPVIIYYKTVAETRLKFTDEQKAVAKEIQKATSYEDTTHIYSTDEVSPVFDIEAVIDLKKLIANTSTTAEEEG